MLVGPAVHSFVLHVPPVDDPVHDLIELGLLCGVEQLEHSRVVIECQRYVLVFLLAQVRNGSPKREPVRCAWPIEVSAVVLTTLIGEEFLHATLRHQLLPRALGVAGRMRRRIRLQLIRSELDRLLTAVAVDADVVDFAIDGLHDASVQSVRGALIGHPDLIVYVESHVKPSLGSRLRVSARPSRYEYWIGESKLVVANSASEKLKVFPTG